jgi:hypothetical protein
VGQRGAGGLPASAENLPSVPDRRIPIHSMVLSMQSIIWPCDSDTRCQDRFFADDRIDDFAAPTQKLDQRSGSSSLTLESVWKEVVRARRKQKHWNLLIAN